MPWFRKTKQYTTGGLESPRDHRDILLGSVQQPIPMNELPEQYIIPYQLPTIDQNGYPACGGCVGATIKNEKERREGNLIDFDWLWIYQQCKKIDGIPTFEGTFGRIVFKVLKDFGAKPLNQLETEAPKYRIGAYASVDDRSFVGLKSAIIQNGVVFARLVISMEGFQTAYVRPPKSNEKTYGHFVSLIGWNKNYIIGKNSWGAWWGDKGLFYFNPDTYAPTECWVSLVDLPNDFVINAKPKFVFTKCLYPNMTGQDVSNLQTALKYFGCFPIIMKESGVYDTVTILGVKQYQASKGLQQTGNFGPTTLKMMNQDLAN